MTYTARSRPTIVIRATPIRVATALLGIALADTMCSSASQGQAISNQPIQSQPGQPLPQKPSAAIPATPPTAPQQNAGTPAERPAQRVPAQHAEIQFTDGMISVEASNASLNQVLREIASKAGIKITGSVDDERVFGHYGPAHAATVLAALLDGTRANMLLVDDANGASELVLTSRRGTASPPSSVAVQETGDDESSETPAPSRYVPPIRPFQPPSAGRGPLTQAPGAPAPQSEGNQPGTDPNNTRQIYEQLRNSQQGSGQQQPQD